MNNGNALVIVMLVAVVVSFFVTLVLKVWQIERGRRGNKPPQKDPNNDVTIGL